MSKDIYEYGETPMKRGRSVPREDDSTRELLSDLDNVQVKAKLRKIVFELFDEWLKKNLKDKLIYEQR